MSEAQALLLWQCEQLGLKPVKEYRFHPTRLWRCETCHLVQERPDYRNYLIEEESTHD